MEAKGFLEFTVSDESVSAHLHKERTFSKHYFPASKNRYLSVSDMPARLMKNMSSVACLTCPCQTWLSQLEQIEFCLYTSRVSCRCNTQ